MGFFAGGNFEKTRLAGKAKSRGQKNPRGSDDPGLEEINMEQEPPQNKEPVKQAVPVKETPFDVIQTEFLMQAGILEKNDEIISKMEKLAKIYNIKFRYSNAGSAYNFNLSGERRNVQKFIDAVKRTG